MIAAQVPEQDSKPKQQQRRAKHPATKHSTQAITGQQTKSQGPGHGAQTQANSTIQETRARAQEQRSVWNHRRCKSIRDKEARPCTRRPGHRAQPQQPCNEPNTYNANTRKARARPGEKQYRNGDETSDQHGDRYCRCCISDSEERRMTNRPQTDHKRHTSKQTQKCMDQ